MTLATYETMVRTGKWPNRGMSAGVRTTIRRQRGWEGSCPVGVLLRERLDRRARAEEVPVAIGVVDSAYARPELVRPHERQRKCGLFPRVRMRPVVCGDG